MSTPPYSLVTDCSSAILTALLMQTRDHLQEWEIESQLFSKMRSITVITISEGCFALIAMASLIEMLARAVIFYTIKAFDFFCPKGSLKTRTLTLLDSVYKGCKESGYFTIINLFLLYFNLTADNVTNSIQQLGKS